MDVLSDIDFLRRDNANLLKEVQSLRLQSSLLRERNNGLERNIQEHLAGTRSHNRRASKSVTIDMTRETIPKLRLDTNVLSPTYDLFRLSLTPDIKLAESLEKQNPQASWFDDSPVHAQAPPPPSMPPPPPPPPSHSEARRSSIIKISNMNGVHLHGSRFIGEAPRPTPERQTEDPPVDQQMPTFTPPSPDPSERRAFPVPSLYSVPPPVTGVALPHVALSLLELKLIRKDTYDSPAAVASFMHKLTRKEHPPQATYRVAFTAAFLDLIPLLGSLPSEWVAFLHDFPSCIPATKRDSIVTLPWPESVATVPTLSPQVKNAAAVRSPTTLNTYQTRRRSRSLDDLRRQSYISVAGKGQNHVMHIQRTPASTGLPPCERDAWVLLLALAYTAYPASRVAKKLRQLPITVKLQIIAWLPPTVNVYDNMRFASNTVDEALGQLWDAKKEILRLKHGWP